jgi:hypothetical protein
MEISWKVREASGTGFYTIQPGIKGTFAWAALKQEVGRVEAGIRANPHVHFARLQTKEWLPSLLNP